MDGIYNDMFFVLLMQFIKVLLKVLIFSNILSRLQPNGRNCPFKVIVKWSYFSEWSETQRGNTIVAYILADFGAFSVRNGIVVFVFFFHVLCHTHKNNWHSRGCRCHSRLPPPEDLLYRKHSGGRFAIRKVYYTTPALHWFVI